MSPVRRAATQYRGGGSRAACLLSAPMSPPGVFPTCARPWGREGSFSLTPFYVGDRAWNVWNRGACLHLRGSPRSVRASVRMCLAPAWQRPVSSPWPRLAVAETVRANCRVRWWLLPPSFPPCPGLREAGAAQQACPTPFRILPESILLTPFPPKTTKSPSLRPQPLLARRCTVSGASTAAKQAMFVGQ